MITPISLARQKDGAQGEQEAGDQSKEHQTATLTPGIDTFQKSISVRGIEQVSQTAISLIAVVFFQFGLI